MPAWSSIGWPTAETMSPDNVDSGPTASMKRVANRRVMSVVSGSMSLPQPALARAILRSPLHAAASALAPVVAAIPRPTWSTGWRPKPAPGGGAVSPIASRGSTSSFSIRPPAAAPLGQALRANLDHGHHQSHFRRVAVGPGHDAERFVDSHYGRRAREWPLSRDLLEDFDAKADVVYN